MTLIPIILTIFSTMRLWNSEKYQTLMWAIVALAVVTWLANEAVRNSYKMERRGMSDRQVTNFWTGASMLLTAITCILAIAGIVLSFN